MNHGGGGRPGKGGRQVTEDEAELWRQLTHSVDKVKTKARVAAHGGESLAPRPAGSSGAKPTQCSRAAPASRAPAAPEPPRAPQPPPLADFDRRTLRQVAAGKVAIDGVLDLHGLHQDTAHARLRAFLVSSQAKGHRMVLVITGKGGGPSGGVRPLASDRRLHREAGGEGYDPVARGVLRRSVPHWLDQPECRAIVLGYAAAGARHGGDGALYVRLRKARDA
jgi:DNA-nicking Smr family endonuclease